MGNFRENVGMFFTELMQDSIKNLKECDENYKDIRSIHANVSRRFYDLFQNFSTKGKEFTESFLEDKSLLDCIEQDWLYLQGYKDCIKLLKLIEAI